MVFFLLIILENCKCKFVKEKNNLIRFFIGLILVYYCGLEGRYNSCLLWSFRLLEECVKCYFMSNVDSNDCFGNKDYI